MNGILNLVFYYMTVTIGPCFEFEMELEKMYYKMELKKMYYIKWNLRNVLYKMYCGPRKLYLLILTYIDRNVNKFMGKGKKT